MQSSHHIGIVTHRAANTRRRDKDHCMAGLQINWIGFDQTIQYVVISMYWNQRIQTGQTGDKNLWGNKTSKDMMVCL